MSQPVTFDELVAKPRRVETHTLHLPGHDGSLLERTIKLRALQGPDFDQLIGEHPPTPEQKKKGNAWNTDTLLPMLLHRCMVEPEISLDQAKQLWGGQALSTGELNTLARWVLDVNMNGFDVPFTAPASDETPSSS